MHDRSMKFSDLLAEALREPGIISRAYSLFHQYSLGNAIAALVQCAARGITVGPIATFPKWKELGRHVRKGERALVLCMPVTCKREREGEDGAKVEDPFTRFVWRPNWFVLAQTDGTSEPAPVAAPGWDADTALGALSIERVPFEHMDGNAQGYARARSVAVSPLAENPLKTLVHELARVIVVGLANRLLQRGCIVDAGHRVVTELTVTVQAEYHGETLSGRCLGS